MYQFQFQSSSLLQFWFCAMRKGKIIFASLMAKIWNSYFLKAKSAVTPDFTAKLSVCMTFLRKECGFKLQQYETCNSSLLEALYRVIPSLEVPNYCL